MENSYNHIPSKSYVLGQSDSRPQVIRLREILATCSVSIETQDPRQSENAVLELVKFLDSISDAAETDLENDITKKNGFEVLSEIYQYICSPSLDQAIIDALSFELPKAVLKFVGVDGCSEVVNNVIDRLIATCSPRDMLSILCEALDFQSHTAKACVYISPLLSGLSKVIPSIQRRHFEQVKATIPVILDALKSVTSESDDVETEFNSLFNIAISIANSIRAVCKKLEGKVDEKLRSLLGLYVLQIMALISISMSSEVSSCCPLISQLSHFFPYCGLSYIGLITGSDIAQMIHTVVGEAEDDFLSCISYVKHGASLSVIWGYICEEVAQAAEGSLSSLEDELRNNQTKRWQAIGILKHVLAFVIVPWKLKKHAIDFLLCITPGDVSKNVDDGQTDWSSYMPSLFVALQAVQMVIIYAPDSVIRKNAFDALKKLLADIPPSQRFNIIKALITSSDSSSMIAILLDLVKGEMHVESRQRSKVGNEEVLQANNRVDPLTSFWNSTVLELVELVLKPPKGGPPSLPEQSDAVLSALNLYRYVLITEATGKTNHTGLLSRNNLEKAYNGWLLPLRTLVKCIMTENKSDYDQLSVDMKCAFNPVELVLYRCIELVEDNLRRST